MFANTDWYLFNFRGHFINELVNSGHTVFIVCPNGEYINSLKELGCKFIPLSITRRGLNPLTELISLLKLYYILYLIKPDILHNFTLKCIIYGTLAAQSLSINTVNAVAGLGFIFSNTSFFANCLKPLVKIFLNYSFKTGFVIFQNPNDIDNLCLEGVLKPCYYTIIMSSGVDTQLYQPSRCCNSSFTVLIATRLLWDKGIKEFIEASKIINEYRNNICFLVAGKIDSGNPSSITEHDIKNWQNLPNLTFLGHVSDMPSLLSKVNIVVLPTTYGEGVPKILTEAAASSIPIITTDTPGCREIVKNEENGFFVPAKDPNALAEAILHLFKDPQKCRNFGVKSREFALERFDVREVNKRTLQVYQRALNSF